MVPETKQTSSDLSFFTSNSVISLISAREIEHLFFWGERERWVWGVSIAPFYDAEAAFLL